MENEKTLGVKNVLAVLAGRGADYQTAEQMKVEDRGVSNQRRVPVCILTLWSRRRRRRDVAVPGKMRKQHAIRGFFTYATKFGIRGCFRHMSKLLAVKTDRVGTLVGKVAKAITPPTSVLLPSVREMH